jgi:hypothetical protein
MSEKLPTYITALIKEKIQKIKRPQELLILYDKKDIK